MKARLLFNRKSVRSLLRYTLVIQTLIVSGCGYAPDFTHPGAPPQLDWIGVRAAVGAIDFPVLRTVHQGETNLEFAWKKKGKLIWWQWPGNTAAQWRFLLFAHNEEGPICGDEKWLDTSDPFKIICEFKTREKLEKYLNKPLTAEIHFRLGGEADGKEAPYRIHQRIFYLVRDSLIIKRPATKT